MNFIGAGACGIYCGFVGILLMVTTVDALALVWRGRVNNKEVNRGPSAV
ncbi:hypothetical protein KCP74_16905 [Salmonella enterica subsp. enterica]|nr:hypothetical protein KCP74_16905 [Salmonella enterica subsp. enterica]